MKAVAVGFFIILMIADLINLFLSLKHLKNHDKWFVEIVTGITMGLLIMSMVLITRW